MDSDMNLLYLQLIIRIKWRKAVENLILTGFLDLLQLCSDVWQINAGRLLNMCKKLLVCVLLINVLKYFILEHKWSYLRGQVDYFFPWDAPGSFLERRNLSVFRVSSSHLSAVKSKCLLHVSVSC